MPKLLFMFISYNVFVQKHMGWGDIDTGTHVKRPIDDN